VEQVVDQVTFDMFGVAVAVTRLEHRYLLLHAGALCTLGPRARITYIPNVRDGREDDDFFKALL
jgi:hypothetical protein